jgi:hypothetical protein
MSTSHETTSSGTTGHGDSLRGSAVWARCPNDRDTHRS